MPNSIPNKIHFATTLLMFSFPIWSSKLVPLIIGIWLISNLIFGIKHSIKTNFKNITPLLIQSSLFIIICISTLFIDRSKEAHFFLERSLSLIIFPLGFYFNPIQFSNKQLKLIKITFSLSTIIIVLICSILAFINIIAFLEENKLLFNISEFIHHPEFEFYFRRFFENHSGLHPTYASMYLGLTIILILDLLVSNLNNYSKKTIVIGVLILLLTFFLMALLASRTPFAATMIAAVLLIILKLKKKIYILYSGIVVLLLSTILYLTVPSFSARLSQISINNTTIPSESGAGDSFNMRTGILHCSLELIESNWLIGIGPGNSQKELDKCYMEIAPEIYEGFHFNTHNQFLGYWLEIGLLGLLSLVFILIITPIQGIKKNNLLPLFICIFFSICFLTENIMVRQQGIVAVALFINLFYFLDYRTKVND